MTRALPADAPQSDPTSDLISLPHLAAEALLPCGVLAAGLLHWAHGPLAALGWALLILTAASLGVLAGDRTRPLRRGLAETRRRYRVNRLRRRVAHHA